MTYELRLGNIADVSRIKKLITRSLGNFHQVDSKPSLVTHKSDSRSANYQQRLISSNERYQRYNHVSMFSKFRRRSSKLEHLDLGDYTAEEYEGCLAELQQVNRWLGDARALRTTLLRTIRASQQKTFSVIDVGAGSGELLRAIAEWATLNDREAQLTGVELNARSASAIAEQSAMFSVNPVRADAFALPFFDNQFDYAICSLFLHHFKNDQAIEILCELNRVARREVVVIDLHRHPVAYYFYTTIGRLLFHNRLIREDGALSILRGFKPAELNDLAERSGLKHVKVLRRFPYRLVLTARKVEVLPLNQREDQQLMRIAS